MGLLIGLIHGGIAILFQVLLVMCLQKKLKALKEDIIQWNRQEFGNVGHRKKELLGALELRDAKEGVLGLTESERDERYEVRSQVEHLLSLEEISW